MKKIRDFVVYSDDRFHSAFPSVVLRPDGELLCAFRRAPSQVFMYGAAKHRHTDANSYLVTVRSNDGGETWTKEPELMFAHPFGGSQDPCMVQLADNSLVCASYGWVVLSEETRVNIDKIVTHAGGTFAFMGGYILRSEDGGRSWLGPFTPMHVEGDKTMSVLGGPVPAYNRGEMIQLADGRLLWAVVANRSNRDRHAEEYLLSSSDRGETWEYVCPIATDDNVQFNETSLLETVDGDIIAFMRTADFDMKATFARSTDGGRSFGQWQDAGFIGVPLQAERLRDGRVFLVYGYRAEGPGVRAKLLKPDCSDITEAPEFIIRDDGGSWDLGYPWAVQLADGNILTVYYINIGDGTRHIAGSLIEI